MPAAAVEGIRLKVHLWLRLMADQVATEAEERALEPRHLLPEHQTLAVAVEVLATIKDHCLVLAKAVLALSSSGIRAHNAQPAALSQMTARTRFTLSRQAERFGLDLWHTSQRLTMQAQ